jgi:spore coat protein CotF
MKNSDINICEIIETRMNQIIDKINKMDDIIESDPLHSELRILDWILYQVCCNEIKHFEKL